MPRNIFLLEPEVHIEDRLTFSWCWILNAAPEIGQRYVDFLSETGGLPKARFLSSTDHPSYTASDRPDMLLTTTEWEILFENKLEAPLNPDQLKRYLSLARTIGEKTRVAFMSRDRRVIADEVLSDSVYVRPKGREHFLWTDIYPIIAGSRAHAAVDFEQYLAFIGLRPEHWGGIGDPFLAAVPLVTKVMVDASERLRRLGWRARSPDEKKWDAIEMPRPLPDIHLGYLKLKKSMGSAEPRVIGRAVEFIV